MLLLGIQLPFKGYIDDVTIWNTSLTSAQWLELYNAGRPGNAMLHSIALTKKLIHYYKMGDGSTFPTITDLTGTANGAVISGSSANFTSSVPG